MCGYFDAPRRPVFNWPETIRQANAVSVSETINFIITTYHKGSTMFQKVRNNNSTFHLQRIESICIEREIILINLNTISGSYTRHKFNGNQVKAEIVNPVTARADKNVYLFDNCVTENCKKQLSISDNCAYNVVTSLLTLLWFF